MLEAVLPRTTKDQADDGLAGAVAALADQVQHDGVTRSGQDAVRLVPLASRFHEAWCPTGGQTNEKCL